MQVNGGPGKGIEGLLREVSESRETIRLESVKNQDSDMRTLCQKEEDVPLNSPVMNLKCRRTLKGHRGRVLHFDWSPDKCHVMTAGQDGYAFIWNAFTGHKEVVIQTTSPWVLACAYAPSTTMVACGGQENQCSLYKVDGHRRGSDDKAHRISLPNKIVGQHLKYITCCTFFGSDQQLLTSSADHTSGLWDLERKSPVQSFAGHKNEVLGQDKHPRDVHTVFASGGADGSTRIWDVRTGNCEMKYTNHEAGINSVKFYPNGEAVASGSSDGTVHMYDLRADQEIKFYSKPSIVFGVSSLDFTRSGRVMFVGYEDYSVRAWDVLKGCHLNMWLHHQDRVSHVQMSPDGTALGTSSWDGTLKVHAC